MTHKELLSKVIDLSNLADEVQAAFILLDCFLDKMDYPKDMESFNNAMYLINMFDQETTDKILELSVGLTSLIHEISEKS